jgi:histidyl-tRNA synthetase
MARLSELGLEARKELGELAELLASRGVETEYNLSVVRGIDYYTGIVFEGFDAQNPRLGSLFGGGRYDALPRLFGRPDLSATGAAGGVERTAMSISGSKATPRGLVYVAVAGKGVSAYALRAQKAIRDSGVPCEASLSFRTLSKQMEDARRLGASWAVIIGDKESRARAVTLRDMDSGKEVVLPLEDAVRRLKQ